MTSNNFEHCHVYTTRFFSSKVKFIYTSTVTRSHSCYGKNYAYASRTSCYNTCVVIKSVITVGVVFVCTVQRKWKTCNLFKTFEVANRFYKKKKLKQEAYIFKRMTENEVDTNISSRTRDIPHLLVMPIMWISMWRCQVLIGWYFCVLDPSGSYNLLLFRL